MAMLTTGSRAHRTTVAAVCVLALLVLVLLDAPRSARAGATQAITTPVQHVYVVKVIDTTNTYTFPDTDQQLLAYVDQVLGRWVTETDGSISSFTRVGTLTTFSTSCANTAAVNTTVWSAAPTLFPGVSFNGTSGNHMVVIAPLGCGSGVGQVSSTTTGLSSGGKVFVDDDPRKGTQSLLHELGHNFSLQHAHALECTTPTSCSVVDYGNEYAIMGATLTRTPAFVPAPLDSFERTRLGVAETCEVPTLALAAGQRSVTATYDLLGRGTDQGTRGLQLVDPQTGDTYFVDWRNHTGRDAGAGYGGTTYNDGVTVEQIENVAGVTSSILQPIPQASPATGYHYGLTAGNTFAIGGLTVHVAAADPSTSPTATTQVTVALTNPSVTGGAPLPTQSGSATISGSTSLGSTLSAVPTAWTPGACYRYQWYDNGVPIAGALSSTYTIPATAAGDHITVAITGQQTGYQPLTTNSAAVIGGVIAQAPASSITSAAPSTTPAAAPASAPSSLSPHRAAPAAGGLALTGADPGAQQRAALAIVGLGVILLVVGAVPPRRFAARQR